MTIANVVLAFALGVASTVSTYVLLQQIRRLLARRRVRRRLLSQARYSDKTVGSRTSLRPRLPKGEGPLSAASFYITSLEVTSLRCFQSETSSFRFPGEGTGLRLPNVNVLLGENGAGKSTLARSIAMAALGPVLERSEYVPFREVRSGAEGATISAAFAVGASSSFVAIENQIELRRRGEVELVRVEASHPAWEETFRETEPGFFVAGYGPLRRVADEGSIDPSVEQGRRNLRYRRVRGLFDEGAPLASLSSWLPRAPGRHRREVISIFEHLIPGDTRFTGSFEGPEAMFEHAGMISPFSALSDGYRSYIGWLGDLLFRVSNAAGSELRLSDIGGVVVVDEVDLLLHPAWQRTVVPAVARALPNMQFVFTTHSPIVASTVEPANILVAEQSDIDPTRSHLVRLKEAIHGRSAEQILLSPYFSLASTRPEDAVRRLEELAAQAVNGDDDDISRYLQALAAGTGDTVPPDPDEDGDGDFRPGRADEAMPEEEPG